MVIERGDTLTYLLHLRKLQSSPMCFPKTKSRIIPFQGDGDSAPDTPPNEESTSNIDDDVDVVKKASMTHREKPAANDVTSSVVKSTNDVETTSPFSVEVKIDLMAFALFLVSFASRMVWLDQPKNVV